MEEDADPVGEYMMEGQMDIFDFIDKPKGKKKAFQWGAKKPSDGQTCRTCRYFGTYVDAYTCEPIGTHCIKDAPLSRDVDADDPACTEWRLKK